MKIIVNHVFVGIVFACLSLTGCGGGGGGGSTNTPSQAASANTDAVGSDLHAVFYATLNAVPVTSVVLLKANGAPISGLGVTFDDSPLTWDNQNLVKPSTAVLTDANGVASKALAQGTYPISFATKGFANISSSGSAVGGFRGSIAPTAAIGGTTKYYQTSRQNWSFTAQSDKVKNITLKVYQTDASGKLVKGSFPRIIDPEVLVVNKAYTPTTTPSITTELFQGTYRVVVNAVDETGKEYAPYVSDVLNVSGGGSIDSFPKNLDKNGNIFTLTLKEGSQLVANDAYTVELYDKATQLMIGSRKSGHDAASPGAVTLMAGTSTDVVAVVKTPAGQVVAIKGYSNLTPTFAAELVKETFIGSIPQPNGPVFTSTTQGIIRVLSNSGAGDFFDDKFNKLNQAPLTNNNTAYVEFTPTFTAGGSFTLKLFDGTYKIKAVGITGYPDSQVVDLVVSSALPNPSINVAVGGVITGLILDTTSNAMNSILVEYRDQNLTYGYQACPGGGTSDANGSYACELPYGTYSIRVKGAVTPDIVLSTSKKTQTLNLLEQRLTGRLLEDSGQGINGTVAVFNSASAGASDQGVYTIKLMQGINTVWLTPPTSKPSIGTKWNSTLIDSTTIKSN